VDAEARSEPLPTRIKAPYNNELKLTAHCRGQIGGGAPQLNSGWVDLRQPGLRMTPIGRRRSIALARALPFAVFASLCIWDAARAPLGRHRFELAMDVSPAAIALALTKAKHMTVVAVVFLLATLAVGLNRLGLAFALTNAVGLTWELAQTTVVGHSARVADLAPNVVVAGGCALMVLLVRIVVRRNRRFGGSGDGHPTTA
jgi:hypothetical protein